jgi:hypothetical protein
MSISKPAIERAEITPNWVELQRVVSLPEAARLSGMSVDTLKRRHAPRIIQLSPRRRGMRIADALNLAVAV